MLSIAQLKRGVNFICNGSPYKVLESAHLKMGRGGGIQQVKMQNMIDGSVISHNFKGNDRLDEAEINYQDASFLYSDNLGFHFMNMVTFDQLTLSQAQIGEAADLLSDGLEVVIQLFNSDPIGVNLPPKIEVKIVETDPGLKGDRANPGTKKAIISTGASVQVPLFVNIGDTVAIDTKTKAYVKRI